MKKVLERLEEAIKSLLELSADEREKALRDSLTMLAELKFANTQWDNEKQQLGNVKKPNK